jgi:hypothetical protein
MHTLYTSRCVGRDFENALATTARIPTRLPQNHDSGDPDLQILCAASGFTFVDLDPPPGLGMIFEDLEIDGDSPLAE